MFPVRSRWMFVRVVGALACFLASAHAQAETYRWVTPDGAVHYGDAMPSGQAERGYDIIDPATGTVIQRIERAKTPQELAAIEAKKNAEAAAAQAAAQKHAAQERYDKMLLDLYSSSADIRRMRDSRLAEIDKQIQQRKNALSRLEESAKSASLADAAHAIPESLKIRKSIARLEDERDRVATQFAADLNRFQQLKPGK